MVVLFAEKAFIVDMGVIPCWFDVAEADGYWLRTHVAPSHISQAEKQHSIIYMVKVSKIGFA